MALQMGNWGYNPTLPLRPTIWGSYLPQSYALRVLLPGVMGCLVFVMNFTLEN